MDHGRSITDKPVLRLLRSARFSATKAASTIDGTNLPKGPNSVLIPKTSKSFSCRAISAHTIIQTGASSMQPCFPMILQISSRSLLSVIRMKLYACIPQAVGARCPASTILLINSRGTGPCLYLRMLFRFRRVFKVGFCILVAL